MKKLFYVVCAALVLNSCGFDDEPSMAREYLLPTQSVEGPESIVLGETATFEVTYERPNDCYIFNGFYYDIHSNVRIVAVKSIVFDEEPCAGQAESTFVAPLEFEPQAVGHYTLKFWTENDDQNQPVYLEKEIDVVNY